MTRACLSLVTQLIFVTSLACAQDLLTRGADIFAKSCATGYCHGVKGGAGGAPRLAARGFDEAYILTVTRAGVQGTAMQAFGTILSRADLAAVVAYVASLNGITPTGNPQAAAGPEPTTLRAEVVPGHDLFFDSVRGFGRCGTCHQVDGFGIPVANPIVKVPPDVAALRALATPQVRTATIDGESFPALIVSQGKTRTTLYDLTSPPPVQRTVDSSAVKITDSSTWRHASVLGSYSDGDLQSILIFLRK
jgi:mono/diheme cytochrome c family protein